MSQKDILPLGLFAVSLSMIGSPWLLGFSGNDSAAISACAIASLMMVCALAALLHRGHFASAGALALGGWSMVAPILFGFVEDAVAFAAHVVAGSAAMLIAVWSVDWRSEGPPEIRV
jgi:hypothetical protein